MPDIEFIQYKMPDGRQIPVNINRPQEVYDKAMEIENEGYIFEAEVLTTGEVSFTIFDPDRDMDLAIEVCLNNTQVPETVDKLIMEFPLHEWKEKDDD